MPARFAVEVQADRPLDWLPDQLLWLGSSWLDDTDPREGRSDHQAPVRAWSVSPPIDLGRHRSRLEFGLLADHLANRLHDAAARGRHGLDLWGVRATVCTVGDGLVQVVAAADWEDLLAAARPVEWLRYRFLSPTVFRSGRRYVPSFHPPLLFGSWWRAWDRHAPVPLPQVDFGALPVDIDRYDLRTADAPIRPGGPEQRVVGFVGEATLDARRLDDDHRRLLDLLSRVADFAGTGAMTTRGFGDTAYAPG